MNSRIVTIVSLSLLLLVLPVQSTMGSCGAGAGGHLQGYNLCEKYFEVMCGDLLKLLPRAMGKFIYENRYDFHRGITFIIRDIEGNPLKQKDLEEIRREAYARLMRDIPYCVEAFKGGELHLDTSASNLAGRLGMIAYSIAILKLPMFPDEKYQGRVSTALASAIVDNQIDVWLFYDGYGDFHSLGELMERLHEEGMPRFRYARNDLYAIKMREDTYSMFRAPDKFETYMLVTNVELNALYNNIVNNIADAYVYIWKCSGMDLAHPSYAAPPGTVIERASRRVTTFAAGQQRTTPLPTAPEPATPTPASPEAGQESAAQER